MNAAARFQPRRSLRSECFRASLAACLAAALTSLSIVASAASAGTFPHRPAGARTRTVTGVLTLYAIGNGSGTFALRKRGGGEIDIEIARPMRIDGKVVRCLNPTPNFAAAGECADWPPNVVVGKTVVTAVCWTDPSVHGGQLVSDEIDTGVTRQTRGARASR